MLYLSGVPSAQAMLSGELGLMLTPNMGNDLTLLPDVAWAADNGCFASKWDKGRWWAFLDYHADKRFNQCCLFAVAPDVVGNARATAELSGPWLEPIRDLGYSVAYVAQDGQEDFSPPWSEFDCLFIGGSTGWKLGEHAKGLALKAGELGKWVHMGRVNSTKRMLLASRWGCDSVDGTFLRWAPEGNLERLRVMLRKVAADVA